MEAPAHICRRLASFHPHLRIGWDGKLRKFGLVQLYHTRDADLTMREPWGNRGAIYSKKGEPRPDWDLLNRKPFYLIALEPEDVSGEGGVLLKKVKRWSRPIASRVYEDRLEAGKQLQRDVEAQTREQALAIYTQGQKDGAGAPIVAKKFVKPTINQMRARRGEFDKTESLLPPTPPGGWRKHLDSDKGDHDTAVTVS